jgi:C4-dicarboxylate-specific signal transduction histidine kinase
VVTELADCDPVWADEHQLQRVLLGLVQNAHQAMIDVDGPRVLTVRLTVDPLGPRAVLAVLDTGPGIPDDALSRIFDPFFTTRAPGEGSGLGLSVAHEIVADHRGRLWAANRPEGGAGFYLELPLQH